MTKTKYLHKVSITSPVKLAFQIGVGFFLGKAVVNMAEIALIKYMLDREKRGRKQEDDPADNIIDISFGEERTEE